MTESSRAKLLALDGDPQDLQSIQDALSDLNLDIHAASGTHEGLQAFKQIRPQIVLLDLTMPGVEEWGSLDAILACDPGAEVIITSAHSSTKSAVEAIQKGACDYLNKPIDVEKLRTRISLLLSQAENRRRTRPSHARRFRQNPESCTSFPECTCDRSNGNRERTGGSSSS
jgi:DNA-binding NtrC family response regulator